MANTVSELCDMHRKAQKLIESASKELTVVSRAMRTLGMKPDLGEIMDDLAKAYMLHGHVWNNSHIYPKEE